MVGPGLKKQQVRNAFPWAEMIVVPPALPGPVKSTGPLAVLLLCRVNTIVFCSRYSRTAKPETP